MIQVQVQHSFYQNFSPPLGNPCFATLPDNNPFIKFSPSQGTARLSTPRKNKQPYSTATLPNYFFKSTTPNRGRVTQHTIQPHIASKSANARPRHAVKEPPETSQHHAKHQAYSSATLPIYCFHSPRTGVRCDPTPIAFCCACHAIVLPYMLQGQLRPYPPHRGRVTTDSEEVGSQPTPLPRSRGIRRNYILSHSNLGP